MSTLFLSGLGLSSYFLALCYVLGMVFTWSKFIYIQSFLARHEFRWSILQLFVLSIALACTFRCMSFSTLCILDFQQIENQNHLQQATLNPFYLPDHISDQSFYNKVVAVLFNIPDYLLVSSYLLLLLLWAENFQSSRRHWFSAQAFRRRWMVFYLIFNALLYLTQLILYTLLFLFDEHDIFIDERGQHLRQIPQLIFYCVAVSDLVLPVIIFFTWVYLTLSLSGFPIKSLNANKRLNRLGRITVVWSFGRIMYSIMILLTFTKGWSNIQSNNAAEKSMILVAVFIASELAPIYLVLDSELLGMLLADHYNPL